MEVFQTSILHLNLCIIFTLLTQEGLSSSFHEHINKTAFEGETVTLKCNNTADGDDITWKKNNVVIFTEDLFNNRTMKNFTSKRMFIEKSTELKIKQIQVSDAGIYYCQNTKGLIRWILTVSENRPEPTKQISLYIISSCTGFIMVGFIISLSIWIHRKQKNSEDAAHRETMEDVTPARGKVQTHNSQYFERITGGL
ncbi:uncharacterized protein LOC130555799 isoform X2 [Triplophysa rosa]|uniref:uncharacterized protein LOC130555799 isoform X2 n=1 Tax=Triplophysa rosa TaxID=992332 RepID=UPI002546008A|nr:uncharacterized protein LOC130555799 isoform X2 [Triplophysa rosa]